MTEIISFKGENLSEEAKVKLDKLKERQKEKNLELIKRFENGEFDKIFDNLK